MNDPRESRWLDQLERDGYAIIPSVFASEELLELRTSLESIMTGGDSDSIRSRSGSVYAARNIVSLFPRSRSIWMREPLTSLLKTVLGERMGLVRGLFFDKPPDRTWSLPWHKDLTIAVRRNDLPSENFGKPTMKTGIAHVEAPQFLLEEMLTLRIHLDTVTDENGPLVVIPGSHREGKHVLETRGTRTKILVHEGDVLMIRPLVTHSSGNSLPGTDRHRRILHLEYAARPELPDGYEWNWFESGFEPTTA